MRKTRDIIQIDQDLCNGCGQCILDCAEGALAIVDGKARLVGEVLCDGLGACLGGCPTGALKVVRREADEFDEAEVQRRQHVAPVAPEPLPTLACGCPSSQAMTLTPAPAPACACQGGEPATVASRLGHWPIKLQLLSPQAPYLQGADLLLLADCAAASLPDLHQRLLGGRAVALACPKLDDAQAHIDKLAQLISGARPRSITVVHMEVPCCKGLEIIAQRAMERAGVTVPLGSMTIGREGRVLHHQPPVVAA